MHRALALALLLSCACTNACVRIGFSRDAGGSQTVDQGPLAGDRGGRELTAPDLSPDGPTTCTAQRAPDAGSPGAVCVSPATGAVLTWPIEADPQPCTNFVGTPFSTTGPGAASWFLWQCGAWKAYPVAAGCGLVIEAWGDCATLYNINYEIWERVGGTYSLARTVASATPVPDPCSAVPKPAIGRQDRQVFVPSPEADRVKLVALQGFYVCVFQTSR